MPSSILHYICYRSFWRTLSSCIYTAWMVKNTKTHQPNTTKKNNHLVCRFTLRPFSQLRSIYHLCWWIQRRLLHRQKLQESPFCMIFANIACTRESANWCKLQITQCDVICECRPIQRKPLQVQQLHSTWYLLPWLLQKNLNSICPNSVSRH